ncbi:MAG: 1,2-phenylacetyl-CoA epoxidase subunit PaaC [Acidimicrobiales bacterium]|nr:phenylacetate-CoA oxygenase subunit PaaC [Acidimicrobiales bacterium]
MNQHLFTYLVRQGDRSLVLAQRLSQWLTNAHELEEEMALGNISLDLIGQTRALFTYAAQVEGQGRTEDDLAYFRSDREFTNPLLVEQPNGDFAVTMVRQFLHDSWAAAYWDLMRSSADPALAAIAGKAVKETAYHLRHARSWVIRLGDGTDESHRRTQDAVDRLWRYTAELFEVDEVETALLESGVAADPVEMKKRWTESVEATLAEATLAIPDLAAAAFSTGGRRGIHSESFSYLIAEMQVVARAHPGAKW